MALINRNGIFHYEFRHRGRRFQGSTRERDRTKALAAYKEIKQRIIKKRKGGTYRKTWKWGARPNYSHCHLRVRKLRGTPQHCEHCGSADDPSKHYEWANVSGRFEDVNDYIRLCKQCHIAYDRERRAQNGLPTSPNANRWKAKLPFLPQPCEAL